MKKKFNHGEVVFFEVDEIPKGAKKLEIKEGFYIVGESETTGNDHRIAVKEGVELYEKDGVLYIKNNVETEIYCPNETRHATKTIPAKIWKRKIAKEFDYFEQIKRKVAD